MFDIQAAFSLLMLFDLCLRSFSKTCALHGLRPARPRAGVSFRPPIFPAVRSSDALCAFKSTSYRWPSIIRSILTVPGALACGIAAAEFGMHLFQMSLKHLVRPVCLGEFDALIGE